MKNLIAAMVTFNCGKISYDRWNEQTAGKDSTQTMEEDKRWCTNSCALLSLDEAKNSGLGLLQAMSFFFFLKNRSIEKIGLGWPV